jgi:hypothetical protein
VVVGCRTWAVMVEVEELRPRVVEAQDATLRVVMEEVQHVSGA